MTRKVTEREREDMLELQARAFGEWVGSSMRNLAKLLLETVAEWDQLSPREKEVRRLEWRRMSEGA